MLSMYVFKEPLDAPRYKQMSGDLKTPTTIQETKYVSLPGIFASIFQAKS